MGLFVFCGALALLGLGYVFYGGWVERVFGPDPARATPACARADGVDYVRLPTYKIFLIQLLNIAGMGPILGPILGALYGPQALVWVVVGCVFGGAVHDYFSGMISLRHGGMSMPDMVGRYLGRHAKRFLVLFNMPFLVLVGVVFVAAPAALLAKTTGWNQTAFAVAIFIYYFLAACLPIHAVIGRIYPFFALALLFMTVSLPIAFVAGGRTVLPDLSFSAGASELPLWPMLFVTIACGAVSGFHATQSPMMARCLATEANGRRVFYGAMIAEGVIAAVWVMLGLSFYDSAEGLRAALLTPKGDLQPLQAVNEITHTLLGDGFGAFLALLGIVALPISTGDTAFRSARLTIADFFGVEQKSLKKRLLLAVPLFVAGAAMMKIGFGSLLLYMNWGTQLLSVFTFWAAAVYLARRGKPYWICAVPGAFMAAVCATYLLCDPKGLALPYGPSVAAGLAAALMCCAAFLVARRKGWLAAADDTPATPVHPATPVAGPCGDDGVSGEK